MNFLYLYITLLFLAVFTTGCASLEESNLDHELRVQGTYVCPSVAVVRPKNENPDATVARCFQDSVVVAREQLRWNRVLYQNADCSGNVQASLHWEAPVLSLKKQELKDLNETQLEVGTLSDMKLVRRNPHWFYDSKGGHCDLRQMPVNSEQVPAKEWACEKFFPSPKVIAQPQKMRFLSEEREGARTLVGKWTGREVACGR